MNSRRILVRGVLAAALLLATPAGAQPPAPPATAAVDPAVKAAARQLAEAGVALFDAGDYPAALDHFNRARELYPAATMDLMAGRSLVKLGRLVEGAERLLAASQMALPPDAGDAQKAAVAHAAAEYKAVSLRIGKLVITVAGGTAGTEVLLDGHPLPPALLGVERPTDPGHHTIRWTRGTEETRRALDLAEGQTLQVVLTIGDTAPPTATEPPKGTQASPPAGPPKTVEPGPEMSDYGPAWGPWVVGGVGIAGTIVGVAVGAYVLHLHSEALGGYNASTMIYTPSAYSAASTGRAIGPISTVGLVIGGVGLAACGIWLGVRSRGTPGGIAVGTGAVPGGAALRIRGAW